MAHEVRVTRTILWAQATDAGNRSMRAAGRTAWSEEDCNVACEAYLVLMDNLDEELPKRW
jgi:hypothetical protein